MRIPKTNTQVAKIQKQIAGLEAKKKTLVRNKHKYAPVSFYKELNKLNKDIEKLEAKI